jgi:hypothetical protein
MYGAVGLIKTWDVSCLFFSSFRSNINLISMTGQELSPYSILCILVMSFLHFVLTYGFLSCRDLICFEGRKSRNNVICLPSHHPVSQAGVLPTPSEHDALYKLVLLTSTHNMFLLLAAILCLHFQRHIS